MNEFLFLIYILIVTGAALTALRMGKEALVALISLQWVLANLFVTKQITLFGFNATSADALAVGATLGLNLLQEYYGKKIAQKTIIISFGATIFYTILSFMQVLYCPSSADTAHAHFCALLTPMPRIVLASVFTYLLVQQLDYRLYGYLKRTMVTRSITVRNYISVGITQLIDTVLFSFLGLYGIIGNIGSVIVISYSIKLAILLCAGPFLLLSKFIYKPNKTNV
jgi:hypothetical protein